MVSFLTGTGGAGGLLSSALGGGTQAPLGQPGTPMPGQVGPPTAGQTGQQAVMQYLTQMQQQQNPFRAALARMLGLGG